MLSLCEDCSLARIQTAAPHRHSLRHGKDKGVKGRSKLIAINSEPTGIKASSTSTTQTQKGDRGYGSQQSSQQDRRRVVNPTQATSTYLEVLIRITVAIEMTTHTYTVKGADHEKVLASEKHTHAVLSPQPRASNWCRPTELCPILLFETVAKCGDAHDRRGGKRTSTYANKTRDGGSPQQQKDEINTATETQDRAVNHSEIRLTDQLNGPSRWQTWMRPSSRSSR